METSKGHLRYSMLHSLLCTGLAGLPFIGMAAVFQATACTLAATWQVPPLSFAAEHVLGLLFALLFHLAAWWATSRTPIKRRRAHFLKAVRAEVPEPSRCPPGPGRALSAKQLSHVFEEFSDLIRDRDMYYVDQNIVRPLTAKVKLSYAELVGPKEVIWFCSHFWGSPFRHLVRTVLCHAQSHANWEQQTFWVCTFSNNQWEIANELGGSSWWKSSFYKALRSPGCCGTLMVFDQQASPLTRAWCLFEVLHTMRLSGQTSTFQGLLLGTESGVLNGGHGSMDVALSLAQRLATLDLRNAQASDPQDLAMIHGLAESSPGGFEVVNGYVRKAIREALEVMHSSFDENVQMVMRTLMSTGVDPAALGCGAEPEVQLHLGEDQEEEKELVPLPRCSASSGRLLTWFMSYMMVLTLLGCVGFQSVKVLIRLQ